jgi:diacylglycerol O-acyltransferase / wax synthase
MQQLSSLDAQFLTIESPTTLGHVGTLIVLDPSTAPDGHVTLDRLRGVIEPRLHLLPPLRQRLVNVPFGLGRPYWFDDPDFDIEFHLRELGLPSPGDERQLGEHIGRIHARPLDRTRPLWELYLIHNVEDGRQAIYAKVHHAAIDGISGMEVLATIMDGTVAPTVVESADQIWNPDPLPGPLDLVGRGVASMAAQPAEALRSLPSTLPHLADVPGASLVPGIQTISDIADSLAQLAGVPGRGARRHTVSTPSTPLNGPITAHRRFAFGSLPLERIKRIKNAFELTVNDVVLALCTSALRRWLLDHDGLPETPIVVAVPVSVRTDDDQGATGNHVSVMLAEMPTHLRDPQERLVAVQAGMAEAKAQFEAVPATILRDLADVIPTALSGLATRAIFSMLSAGGLPFNLFISNIPGPQEPLYIAGASVLGLYPASAITDVTGALNITLFSYNGSLDFGLIACRELLPDVWNLIDYLGDALDELDKLVDEEASSQTEG